MTTCHACGSDTVEGATCVVCGAQPPADDPANDGDGTADVEDGAGTAPGEDPSWPASAETVPDAPVQDVVTSGDRGSSAAPRVPVGAGVAGGSGRDQHAAVGPGQTPPVGTTGGRLGGGAVPPPPAPGRMPGAPAPGSALSASAPTPGALAVSEASRNWAMVTHLSALVSAGLGGLIFLGPLLVWLVKKDEDRYVAHHATEALNFNLSMTLYAILGFFLALTVVGLVVAIPMAIIGFPLWFVASIVAAVRAQRGEGFRYPLTIRLVRE